MFKKTTALLLVAVFLISALTVLANTSDDVQLLGDINGDGEINEQDYILCKRYVLGTCALSDAQLISADVNLDGDVNGLDYLLLKRHAFGTYTIVQPDNDDTSGSESDDSSDDSSSDVVNPYNPYNYLVSSGKTYTTSVSASSSYPDSYNCELTDMFFDTSVSYSADVFSGYNKDVEIVVDLENDGVDLNKFELSYLSVNNAGIYVPASVAVYASDNSYYWQYLGSMDIPEFQNGVVDRASLVLDTSVSYRYIRYVITKKTAWVFLDEILIYSENLQVGSSGLLGDAYDNCALNDEMIITNREFVSSGNSVDKSLGLQNVALGAEYTISCASFDSRTEESDTILTNGALTGAPLELENWLGINNTEQNAEIVVDLGDVRNDIAGFAMHCFNRPFSSIALPEYVEIAVSQNGVDFYTIAVSYSADFEQENYAFSEFLSETIEARYVKFIISTGDENCWIEEVEIYANSEVEEVISVHLYDDFEFAVTDEPYYWDEDLDYDITQNLILGLNQEMMTDVYLDQNAEVPHNAPEHTTLLTDGVTTDDTYCYNGYWNQFHRGDGRKIFYDIGYISSISSYSIRFLYDIKFGIYNPDNVKLVLSENGTDWYTASDIYLFDIEEGIVTVGEDFDVPYRARYVMFYFDVRVHVFVDELEVLGTKNTEGAAPVDSLPVYDIVLNESTGQPLGYASPDAELIGGAEDVCLIYHNIITADTEFFKPYVAYLDKNGNVLDTMFDAYLFLPSTGSLPSGGTPHSTNIASDWVYLYNELFKANMNFDALNDTAEYVKNELGLSDYKLKVFATIPLMDGTRADFGDVNGDGINEDITTLAGRVDTARKYIGMIIDTFNSMEYENIELCGFYWFHETIGGDDVETVKAVNKMAHDEYSTQMFWIPYFSAAGYTKWQEFGFDVGCLQPNYAFKLTVEESRISSAATIANHFGMCIEMELDGKELSDKRYFDKYMKYLGGGVEYGYMNDAIHMYYQGGSTIASAYYSSNERVRLIYEYTYQFIKGTLDTTPDTVSEIKKSVSANTALIGTLNPYSDLSKEYQIAYSPVHGTVSIAEDGSYVYYPNKGFTGTDTFTYRIGNHLGWSDECTVTVTVG